MKPIIIIFIICLAIIVFACLMQEAGWPNPDFQGIVIHHSATDGGTVESIRKYHIEYNGWDDIGYHFIIYRDGSIHAGRSLEKVGAHALGRNSTHIGICLIAKDKFTNAQIDSFIQLCRELKKKYSILTIESHHEQCPGPGIALDALRRQIF